MKMRATTGTGGFVLIVVAAFQLLTFDHGASDAKAEEETRFAQHQTEVKEKLAVTTTAAPAVTTTVPPSIPATTQRVTTTTAAPATTTTTTVPPPPVYTHGDIPPNTPFGLFTSVEMELADTPLLEGDLADADKRALDGGVAHRPTTGFPGSGGNVVITGHRRSVGKDVFRHIDKLAIGSLIQIQTAWNGRTDTFVYEVEHTEAGIETSTPELEVRFVETYFVTQAEYETLTLVSCDPPGSTTHRYLVRARLVSVSGESR